MGNVGSREFKLSVGSRAVRAKLLDNQAPRICRELAVDARLSASEVGLLVTTMLRRTQSRLSHWGFPDACAVLGEVASHSERAPPAETSDELIALIESALLYVDRLQNWIDAMIPWRDMDKSLQLLPLPQ